MAWLSWERLGMAKEKGGLGYKDLENFNLALLAKQGWRLLQQPESLVAKVFKQKYYPNGNFMDSQLGRNPSYAWRSIWNGKPLLFEGLIWRIGNGQSVRIWGDRWIPAPLAFLMQRSIGGLTSDAKVSSLIDEETCWWNFQLVQDNFNREVADFICNIPVFPQRQQDKLIWAGTKNGVFSVRSAYHLALDKKERNRGSCSYEEHSKRLWKIVWKVEVPTVAKVFLWKACSNILPTKLNLFRKGIVPDALCPICDLYEETVKHVLWTCEAAKDVWSACRIRIQKMCSYGGGFYFFIFAPLAEAGS
jgi:hypothetical protein